MKQSEAGYAGIWRTTVIAGHCWVRGHAVRRYGRGVGPGVASGTGWSTCTGKGVGPVKV